MAVRRQMPYRPPPPCLVSVDVRGTGSLGTLYYDGTFPISTDETVGRTESKGVGDDNMS